MSDAYEINTTGLDKLLKALKQKPPTARVGVLGSAGRKSGRGKQAPSNADVGAVHEYGAPARGIPARSFLRIPISENLQKYMEKSGAFDFDTISNVIKQGTVIPWLKKVSAISLTIVQDAFDSSGFGKWPKWKIPGYTNNAGQILVDTQQLRNSVTDEVKENG